MTRPNRKMRRQIEHARKNAGGVVGVLHVEVWKDGTTIRNASASDAMVLATLGDEAQLVLAELREQGGDQPASEPVEAVAQEGP